ncbi:hypothetical protein [Desertivirga arenae]|uniref:hypothetical protein n=1 Tax=Desertivirga arenae TaxID=2810309 RepID=UPI001A979146|nr:hypothetical protein [Pedobacter sp. SYSU D00823]
MTTDLSQEEFQQTFGISMVDVTGTAEPATDIWPYVEVLKDDGVVQDFVYAQGLVKTVYRNLENMYDHVLLPTEYMNKFIVIVVDLVARDIKGHFILDLEREYGLK